MIDFVNSTSYALDSKIIDFLEKILKSVCDNDVELIIVDEDEIRRLNREFLGRDYATDVLSFGLTSEINAPHVPLGSIVISLNAAREVSEKLGHSLRNEMAILFTHGLLHLLGYNHECDNGEHRAKECEILAHFGITNPLIQRTLKCK